MRSFFWIGIFLAAGGVGLADVTHPPLPPAAAPSIPSGTSGTIARRALTRVLDAAPAAFLQQVVPEPRFRDGRFHGWRLAAFFPGDVRFAGVDVHAGDVIVRVNGSTVEKPEQLMQVWDDLRRARELTVELERDGAPRRLRWIIAD